MLVCRYVLDSLYVGMFLDSLYDFVGWYLAVVTVVEVVIAQFLFLAMFLDSLYVGMFLDSLYVGMFLDRYVDRLYVGM